MNKILSGVILVTGEHGTGKTRLGLESGDIRKTYFVDDDLKGRSTVDRIKNDLSEVGVTVGKYVDFLELTSNKKSLDIHKIGLDLIESIPEGEYDVLVWDTWTRFASTTKSYVSAHPSKFRDKDEWAAMGKIRNGEEWKEARLYEAELIAKIQKKVPLVILVSHLKNHYQNNVQTGKMIPAVSKAIDRVTNMRLWVRHNPKATTPIALVLKNIEKNRYDEATGRIKPIKVFPTKITPRPGDESLWDTLEYYYNNPIGDRKPTQDETPDDFERSIVEGTLTEDQRISWLHALKVQQEEEKMMAAMRNAEMTAMAKELKEENLPLPVIASKLKNEFGIEVSIPDVNKMLQ